MCNLNLPQYFTHSSVIHPYPSGGYRKSINRWLIRCSFVMFMMGIDYNTLLAQTIVVSGSPWIASMNYPFNEVLSPDPQVQISVRPDKNDWLVTIERSDNDWDSSLRLSIRRTGDGSGNPLSLPEGGLSWIEIAESPQNFFWGEDKNRSNVPCQYRLQANWPPEGTYSTIVLFTLIAL